MIRRLELTPQLFLKARHNVDVQSILFRKKHRFGTENRVQSSIIAIKCEEGNRTILRDPVAEISTKQYIGKKATFLPHGLIHKIGFETYRNILIDHNRYLNSIHAITMYDVEEDSLKNTLLNTWKYDEDNEHTIINFLFENYGLIAV